MTEKDYSGTITGKIGKNAKANTGSEKGSLQIAKKQTKEKVSEESASSIDVESYKKAGDIAKKTREFAKDIIKENV